MPDLDTLLELHLRIESLHMVAIFIFITIAAERKWLQMDAPCFVNREMQEITSKLKNEIIQILLRLEVLLLRITDGIGMENVGARPTM